MSAALPLRDIHLPDPPALWPPAPGWWLLAMLLAAVLAMLGRFVWRRYRERRLRGRFADAFDQELLNTSSASARLAAASMLLRRASRRCARAAAVRSGESWLEFLDGDDPDRPFSRGAGRVLLDGPFRPRTSASEADAAVRLARQRFLELVRGDA